MKVYYDFLCSDDDIIKANLMTREDGILSGIDVFCCVFRILNPEIKIDLFFKDGDKMPSSISSHFIYSEYLYNVQSDILKIYHNVTEDVLYKKVDTPLLPLVIGFEIKLPQIQDAKKPYIFLYRQNEPFIVEMGSSANGNAKRIINKIYEKCLTYNPPDKSIIFYYKILIKPVDLLLSTVNKSTGSYHSDSNKALTARYVI